MKLRRFTDAGVEKTRAFLAAVKEANNVDAVTLDGEPFTRATLLSSPAYSYAIPALADIDLDETRTFDTTFAFCEYFDSLIHDHNPQAYRKDVGFWTWLAMVYLPQLVTESKKGLSVGDMTRLVYHPENYQRQYRHLLAGAFYVYVLYSQTPGTCHFIFTHKLNVFPDVAEQIMSKQSIVQNPAFMRAANALDGIAQVPTGVRAAEYHAAVQWAAQPSVKSKANLSSAYKAYVSFLKWFDEQEAKREKRKPSTSAGDLLTVALKMFEKNRKEEEWCSDKTDGDENKPRVGYVANVMRRQASVTSATVAQLNHGTAMQIRAWFKSAIDPTTEKSIVEAVNDGDLVSFGPYLSFLIQPTTPAPARPAKFSRSVESVAKNMIKPDEYGVYDEHVHKALKFLGLISFDYSIEFTNLDYDDVLHAQRVILRRLREMKLPQVQEFGKTYNPPPDSNWKDADYLTVNEFLWFVNKYNTDISKECEAKKMTPAKVTKPSKSGSKLKVDYSKSEDVLLLRLMAALKTKPFAILAGHSGTGKSRMVRRLAYMTCNNMELRDGDEPGNFCMVQVKPNWHDSTELLGYRTFEGHYKPTAFVKFLCKAHAYPDTPFFVCLDEMNLAPVEQYFAEYLSAIESRKVKKLKIKKWDDSQGKIVEEDNVGCIWTDPLIDKDEYNKLASELGCEKEQAQYWIENYGFSIPGNVFMIGTVNMDESTNQFSRKVLDRAMTIEMLDADFSSFGKKVPELKFDDEALDDTSIGLLMSKKVFADKELDSTPKANLEFLKEKLSPTPFAVAYRFANEYALYDEALKAIDGILDKPATAQPAGSAGATSVSPATANPPAASSGSADNAASSSVAAPKKPEAFDDIVLMKLLPRIAGEADAVRKIFTGKADWKKGDQFTDGLLSKLGKGTASGDKMLKILEREDAQFLSFWP